MLFQEIYNSLIQARKNHQELEKSILALLYSNLKNRAIELRVEELADADTISVIKKLNKQLDEEIQSLAPIRATSEKAEAKINELVKQKKLIEKYLPKQLSEEEIRVIYNSLEDKSIPSVMKYFKTTYNGLVDMSLVSKIARG